MTALLDIDWPQKPRNVEVAFTLKAGAGPYGSFNLANHVGDDARAVEASRAALKDALRLPAEPAWLRQVHGIEVHQLHHAGRNAHGDPVEADASVADRYGGVCAVLVADCLPVLLAANDGSSIAAAHAGWRGLAAGVLEATVRSMCAPASQVTAWIGPGICQAHFEVGPEVRDAFTAQTSDAAAAFTPNARGRWQCDLKALAKARLLALGIGSVATAAECTYEDSARFYSYRRDGRCGRMAALIWRAA